MYHYTIALRDYLGALLGTHRARFAHARERGDARASASNWPSSPPSFWPSPSDCSR